jgi:hypothetical protein
MGEDEMNGKATIREVNAMYNAMRAEMQKQFDPLIKGQVRLETLIEEFIKNSKETHKDIEDQITDVCQSNTKEHENFVSTKNFRNTSILIGALIAIVATIQTLVGLGVIGG